MTGIAQLPASTVACYVGAGALLALGLFVGVTQMRPAPMVLGILGAGLLWGLGRYLRHHKLRPLFVEREP